MRVMVICVVSCLVGYCLGASCLEDLAECVSPLLQSARGVEVICLPDGANLEFPFLEWTALDPLDGLVHRLHLPGAVSQQ